MGTAKTRTNNRRDLEKNKRKPRLDAVKSQTNQFGAKQQYPKENSRKTDNRNRNANQTKSKSKTIRIENKDSFGEVTREHNGETVMMNLKRGFTLGEGRKSTFRSNGKEITANTQINTQERHIPRNKKEQGNLKETRQGQANTGNKKNNTKQDKRRQHRNQHRTNSKNPRLKNSEVLKHIDVNRVTDKNGILAKSKKETAPTEIVTEDENADNETVRDENDDPKTTHSRGRTHSRKQNETIPKLSKQRSKHKRPNAQKLERPIDKILQKLNIAMGQKSKHQAHKNPQNSNFSTNKDTAKRPSKSILRKSSRKRKSSQPPDSLRFENLEQGNNLQRLKSNKNSSHRSGNQTPAFEFGSDLELSSTRDQIGSESSGINKREKNLMDLLKRLGAKSNPACPESDRAEMDKAQIKGWFERVWARIRRVKKDEEENGEYQRIKKEIIEKKQMSSKQIVRINSKDSFLYLYLYYYF